jgi:L-asparaginase II
MSDQRDNAVECAAELIEVWRGPLIESKHLGHLIAVDPFDRAVATLGSPDTVTYLRSSGKPFQALPAVASGAADAFGFSEQEIAIACGSHNGEPAHVETVQSMLDKIGLDESALKCGAHEPYSIDVAREMVRQQQAPTPIQNNCSGKHAAMLALARHLGAPTGTYDQLDNPVQQMILQTVAEFSGVPVGDISIGIDGCGVPVFGISVRAMALMYARLVNPPSEMSADVRDACQRIVQAMVNFPIMIGGTRDRLDTELIMAGKGRLISKIGAEGVYTVGVLPSEKWPNGLGFALKIADGDDRRARPPAVIDALRQLGVLSQDDLKNLEKYSPTAITNRRGDHVGEVRASFTLDIRHP